MNGYKPVVHIHNYCEVFEKYTQVSKFKGHIV